MRKMLDAKLKNKLFNKIIVSVERISKINNGM